MKIKRILSPIIACSVLLAACNTKVSEHQVEEHDELASHIDSTIKSSDDFFTHANGKWFNAHPIPDNKQSNGLWQLIQDTINAQVKNICESSSANANQEKGSNKQKIGDFYFSGMDSVTRNKNGISDLKADFDKIDQAADLKELMQVAAYIHSVSGSPLFDIHVAQDDKNSSKNAVFLSQGGLSLPDRSFYFDTDARTVSIREEFVVYLANMFKIMGNDEAKAKASAENIMKLETELAKMSRKTEDTRDPHKNYNKLAFNKFAASCPGIDWTSFTTALGLSQVDSLIVGQPEFFTALNTKLKSIPLDQWKNYLKFQHINGLASFMDDNTYMEYFNFYAVKLSGVKQPKPRWERIVKQTNESLGELIGQVYVSEYLPKGTKEKLSEIGESIRSVYAERIKSLDWMSAPTKEKALSKLNKIIMKVGYPDKWKDLSGMQIDRTSYLKNVISAKKWAYQEMISKYGKPVDRTEWHMTPQTYNAYYNPSNNEIVVPGCNILVPGYEGKLADDAILYSIIGGSTFGHEITHGFDDQGSKYDEFGNLNNWWTADDSVKFYGKTKMIIDQFNEYVAVDSLHINGELTQGENIADLGGTVMGYEAFKKTNQFKTNQLVGGLNPSQRFFYAYALAWMINERPENIAIKVKSDPHSPAKFRVIGPIVNMPEFYTTFGIKKGDAMWRDQDRRIKIW